MKQNTAHFRYIIIIFLTVITSIQTRCLAQDKDFFNTSMKVSSEYIFRQSLRDTTGTFSNWKSNVNVNIPLYSRRHSLTNSLEYRTLAFLANVGGTYSMPQLSMLQTQHQLINTTAGVIGIYSSGSLNTFVADLSANLAEDFFTIAQPQVRVAGSIILKHKVNGGFSYMVGAVYTYLYGQALPLPILGFNVRVGKTGKLRVILPLNISYENKFNSYDLFSVFIHPDGGLNNFANKNDALFLGYPGVIQFRQRAFQAGVSYKVFINDHLKLTPEAGFMAGRTISFSNRGDMSSASFYSQKVKPSPYLKVTLHYIFGDLKWKRTGNNFLLNDERMDDYDMDDPAKL